MKKTNRDMEETPVPAEEVIKTGLNGISDMFGKKKTDWLYSKIVPHGDGMISFSEDMQRLGVLMPGCIWIDQKNGGRRKKVAAFCWFPSRVKNYFAYQARESYKRKKAARAARQES